MAIRVLGPLETGNEAGLSPRERVVLAALIVRAGRAVAPGELAEACWGDAPPRTWPQQVKTSVARIRAGLGRTAVVTRGSEYTLGIDPATIDAFEFERLVSEARRHGLHDEHDRAVDAYRRALALWHGEAYADIADWEPAAVEAERLAEIRRSAEEELLEARLAEGERRAVVADAERLVRESPLRENRWAILATANYRAGRQADALATLRAARTRLSDELGIDVGERLRSLETAMLQQDPSLSPAKTLHRVRESCPYPGLEAFTATDAEDFFGRDADIEALRERARPGSLTVVVGASGSGKSSVLLAGVLPRIAEGRRAAVVTAGRDAATDLRARVEQRGAADVVVIDQAEVVFQLSERERETLCAIVADVLAMGSTVLLTLRSDFLDRATGLPHIGASVGRGVYALGPLSVQGLRDAVEQPATRAGLRLEPGLVELIVRDAGDRRTTLPHVSHALVETWVRREGATLTVAGYEASGGIAGAIAQSAESLYRSLDAENADACRALMLRLVHRGADGTSLRRSAALAPLAADAVRRRVLDRLVTARLLTIDGDEVMVAHEAVATAWPRLDGWLEEDAEEARLVSSVATAAELWDASGQRDEDLLRGARLQAAAEWREASHPDLTAVEHDFLEASAAHEADEMRELADRAARETRSNRRLRWALGGGAVLLVAALVSGGVAVVRGQDAAASAEEALIEAVTSTSTSLLSTNRDVAALLAVEAHRRWPDDSRTSRALIASSISAGPLVQTTIIPDARWRIGAWPIPGTGQVAVVREYTDLGIHDMNTGVLVRTIARLPDTDHLFRPWVRVSADGSTIAVIQHINEEPDLAEGQDHPDLRDELVHFFDVASGSRIGSPIRVDELSAEAELSPDGSLLTWASVGRLVVVERDTGSIRRSDAIKHEGAAMYEAAGASDFLPDGTIVATNTANAGIVLDAATLDVLERFTVAPGTGGWRVDATDDGLITSLGPEGISTLTASGEQIWTGEVAREGCTRLVVSQVNRRIICGDENGNLRMWDLDTGETVGRPWSYQHGGAGDLALSDDESEILLMSALAPAIARVRIDGSGPVSRALGEDDLVVAWGFDPTGRYVVLGVRASLENDAAMPLYRIWDTVDSSLVLRIPEDLDVPDGTIVSDPRWVGENQVFVWIPDLETNLLDTAVVDMRTGDMRDLKLPDNVWWVFSDPAAEVAFVALADIPETDAVEPSELRTYDARTWEQLPLRIDADGTIQHVSATPDHSLIAVTEHFEMGEPAYRTTVYDDDGRMLAEGLPQTQATVLLSDGTLVAASGPQLERYDARTLDRIGSFPAGGSFAWNLSASGDGLIVDHGGAGEGVALVDAKTNRRIGERIPAVAGALSVISPDGLSMAISGPGGVQSWTLDPDDHARAACGFVGREPTAEEWRTYFGDLGPQHPLCEDLLASAP